MGRNEDKLIHFLYRGIRKRCPRCGRGRLFSHWYRLYRECSECGLQFLRDPIDILAVMYISAALVTGIGVIILFLIVPTNVWLGRVLVGVLALVIFVLSSPYRKGVAIAFDYWGENRFNREDGPSS